MDFQQAKSFFDNQKQPVSLYQNLWSENTTVLFHSPRTDTDKTKTALLIANNVAESGRDVLYISAKPSMDKYRAESERLFIFTPKFESIDDKRDYADLIFEAIEHAVRNTGIRTFVIDSLTRIAGLSFGRNASAAYIMKRLVALQVKCELSLLVIADDTTKSSMRALGALADGEIAPVQDQTDFATADTSSEESAEARLADMADSSDLPAQATPTTPQPVSGLSRSQRRRARARARALKQSAEQ